MVFAPTPRVRPWSLCGLGAVTLALLASCAVPGMTQRREARPPEPPVTPPETGTPQALPLPEQAVRRAPRRGARAPIPTRPINVKAACSFQDPTGYRGAMKLQVTQAKVEVFEATVDIPKHGRCHFDLKDFHQISTLPIPQLSNPGTGCVVRIWEQGHQVTVAFNNCHTKCTGEAFSYLWPILTDARTGGCG